MHVMGALGTIAGRTDCKSVLRIAGLLLAVPESDLEVLEARPRCDDVHGQRSLGWRRRQADRADSRTTQNRGTEALRTSHGQTRALLRRLSVPGRHLLLTSEEWSR